MVPWQARAPQKKYTAANHSPEIVHAHVTSGAFSCEHYVRLLEALPAVSELDAARFWSSAMSDHVGRLDRTASIFARLVLAFFNSLEAFFCSALMLCRFFSIVRYCLRAPPSPQSRLTRSRPEQPSIRARGQFFSGFRLGNSLSSRRRNGFGACLFFLFRGCRSGHFLCSCVVHQFALATDADTLASTMESGPGTALGPCAATDLSGAPIFFVIRVLGTHVWLDRGACRMSAS